MSTRFYLTDENSFIAGYKRAKLGSRSDCCSLVRSVTDTVLNDMLTRKAISTPSLYGSGQSLHWISDPLDGPNLTNGTWDLHAWAYVDVAANAGLHLSVKRFTSGESTEIVAATAALGIALLDVDLTTGPATPITLDPGDRLVFTLTLVDSVGLIVAGHLVTVSYNGLYPHSEGDTYVVCPDNIEIPDDLPDGEVEMVKSVLSDLGQASPQIEEDRVKGYIRQAIQTYSVDRPREVAEYISGNQNTFDFPLPSKWIWDFSRLVGIEWPADQQIPSPLDTIDWELRETILGPQPLRFIRFRTVTPDTGVNNVVLIYTTRHEHTKEFSTISPEAYQAVLWLAGSYCAIELASKGAGSVDSDIAADSVNHRDAEQRWSNVARRLKDMYTHRVISPSSATPVGTTEEWRPILQTGQNFMWHSRRVRRVR